MTPIIGEIHYTDGAHEPVIIIATASRDLLLQEKNGFIFWLEWDFKDRSYRMWDRKNKKFIQHVVIQSGLRANAASPIITAH